jgi:hypothetical protein
MIHTILNAILTPAAVASPPPELPAIVQTYDWRTQTSHIDPASLGGMTNAMFPTQCIVMIPGKTPFLFPDD